MVNPANIHCKGCKQHPNDIPEYVIEAKSYPQPFTPVDFVKEEEGTYNEETGQFWCTACYIKAGMPLGTA
jgi:hypothetical protein